MMNSVNLIGNLTADPELRFTKNGKAVASFTLAVNRGWGDKQETDFIRCQIWEKKAEALAENQVKGNKIGVTGRLQVRQYTTNEGEKKTIAEVVVNETFWLSPKNKPASDDFPDFEPLDDDNDDIPF